MMHEGRIILELADEFKEKMTVKGLLQEFEHLRGETFASDRVVLAT